MVGKIHGNISGKEKRGSEEMEKTTSCSCNLCIPTMHPVHGGDMLECDIQCPKELHLECRAELVLA